MHIVPVRSLRESGSRAWLHSWLLPVGRPPPSRATLLSWALVNDRDPLEAEALVDAAEKRARNAGGDRGAMSLR